MNISESQTYILDVVLSQHEFNALTLERLKARQMPVQKFNVGFAEPFDMSFVMEKGDNMDIENDDILSAIQALNEGEDDALGVFLLDIITTKNNVFGFDRKKHGAVTVTVTPDKGSVILMN